MAIEKDFENEIQTLSLQLKTESEKCIALEKDFTDKLSKQDQMVGQTESRTEQVQLSVKDIHNTSIEVIETLQKQIKSLTAQNEQLTISADQAKADSAMRKEDELMLVSVMYELGLEI